MSDSHKQTVPATASVAGARIQPTTTPGRLFPIFEIPEEIESRLIARYREATHFPLLDIVQASKAPTDATLFHTDNSNSTHRAHLQDSLRYFGVYILFYTGQHQLYSDLSTYNRESLNHSGKALKPIYIGKAIASGARTGAASTTTDSTTEDPMTTVEAQEAMTVKTDSMTNSLLGRLREHLKSIESTRRITAEANLAEVQRHRDFQHNDFTSMMRYFTAELDPRDFQVCVIPMPSALVQWAEATLINKLAPVWNSTISGFGNHDPGKGRYVQKRSIWDQLHPGRKWAFKLNNAADLDQKAIQNRIRDDLQKHL